MSLQDIRNTIICDHLPKLVNLLAGHVSSVIIVSLITLIKYLYIFVIEHRHRKLAIMRAIRFVQSTPPQLSIGKFS